MTRDSSINKEEEGGEDLVGSRPQRCGHGCHHVLWHHRAQVRLASEGTVTRRRREEGSTGLAFVVPSFWLSGRAGLNPNGSDNVVLNFFTVPLATSPRGTRARRTGERFGLIDQDIRAILGKRLLDAQGSSEESNLTGTTIYRK